MHPINSSIKVARDEVGVSHHVPITHLNSPTVLESQSGAIFSVIKFAGVPFATVSAEILNQYSYSWHQALTALNENFAIVGHIHRRKIQSDLPGQFTNQFAKTFNDAYSRQLTKRNLYVNDLYLAIIYKGIDVGHIGRVNRLLQQINQRYIKTARNIQRQQMIERLKEAVRQLMIALREFQPLLVGSQDAVSGHSELLAYLSILVNAGEGLELKLGSHPTCYPAGNLSQFITAKQLFFDRYIQFQGVQQTDKRFAAIVTIKRYAANSASIMLDPLLQLDSEFISTHSFCRLNQVLADKYMQRQSFKLQNANDPAISQISALDHARDQLASDQISMGYHHNTVMIISDSIATLEEQIACAIKCYLQVGVVAVRETIAQEAAFWAQVPTNFKYITRASLITSKNFVDFFPLHNFHSGYVNANHLGDAMMLVETPSRTPLYLNLHAAGPKDNPSVGHTVMIGGSGSGKTVAMCCFDAQLNRYAGNSYFFDRNRGAEIYVRASGGSYLVLAPDHTRQLHFNPFALADTAVNRQFCKALLVQLVRSEDQPVIDEASIAALENCVHYAFDKLAPEHRTLSNATCILPIDFKPRLRLRRWLRGNSCTVDGEYAYLFDNSADALHMQAKMGFDLTHFLDREPPDVLVALLMYLFHRVELCLQASKVLTSIFLDEAWQYLDNCYWQAKLKNWLPTLRKYNCHIIFATQSPHSVIDSAVGHSILDNCATQLYFANPQAKFEHYVKGFNLTASEFHCIKNHVPQSRIFLYKQGHWSTLGRLNLNGMADMLSVMSATQININLLSDIRNTISEDPLYWLPEFLQRSQANVH